jgi:hypothetical protein
LFEEHDKVRIDLRVEFNDFLQINVASKQAGYLAGVYLSDGVLKQVQHDVMSVLFRSLFCNSSCGTSEQNLLKAQ